MRVIWLSGYIKGLTHKSQCFKVKINFLYWMPYSDLEISCISSIYLYTFKISECCYMIPLWIQSCLWWLIWQMAKFTVAACWTGFWMQALHNGSPNCAYEIIYHSRIRNLKAHYSHQPIIIKKFKDLISMDIWVDLRFGKLKKINACYWNNRRLFENKNQFETPVASGHSRSSLKSQLKLIS